MSFICPICKELLLSTHNSDDIIVTTKCGHLYHSSCLTTFFETQEHVPTSPAVHGSNFVLAKSHCPSCQSVVLTRNLIQVYPSQEDDDPFGKLIARCNSLVLRNEELKRNNKILAAENEELKKLPGASVLVNGNKSDKVGLSIQDLVVWFPDVSSVEEDCTPEAGRVKWIGRINEVLFAGIEFDNPIGNDASDTEIAPLFPCKSKYGKCVPVNELILYSDFYLEAVGATTVPLKSEETPANDFPSVIKISEPKITLEKYNSFEKQLNEFISMLGTGEEEYRVLLDESKRLASEEIIAIPSAIEDQLKRASEVRSDMIKKERFAENLKKLSIDILQYDDITTQEISILKDGILLLERMRDSCKQNLAKLQFSTALGHSQKVKSFLQGGFQWLNEMELQFGLLVGANHMDVADSTYIKPSTSELLKMKIDLEFRQPQMEHLATAYNFFQSPGLKLKRNDQTLLKTALDSFDELKTRKAVLNNAILREAHNMFKVLDDWCKDVNFIMETEFGAQLLAKLLELADHEELIRDEIPKLEELRNVMSKDGISGFTEFSRDLEKIKQRVEYTSNELKSEIKQLKSKPLVAKAYY